jgi:hypothetical protein
MLHFNHLILIDYVCVCMLHACSDEYSMDPTSYLPLPPTDDNIFTSVDTRHAQRNGVRFMLIYMLMSVHV